MSIETAEKGNMEPHAELRESLLEAVVVADTVAEDVKALARAAGLSDEIEKMFPGDAQRDHQTQA